MAYIPSASVLTWFSRLKETAYGTKTASGAPYRRMGEINRILFDIVPNFEQDMENAGSDEPVDSYITTNIFEESPIETYFSFQDIGYWLQMIMGSIAAAGAGVPYTHTVTAQNKQTSRQHPTRTFGQRKGSDILIYTSVGLKELRIAKDSTGRLRVTITPHGQGKVDLNPASYAVPSVVSDRIYGFNNQASHQLNDTIASLTDNYQCAVESWEWVFTNNPVDEGFRDCSANYEANNPHSGQIRSEYLTSEYQWKFNCTVRLDTGHNARTMMRNGDLITISTGIESTELLSDDATNPSLTLTDSNAKIVRIKDTMQDKGFILREINCELKAFKTTGQMSTTAELINDVASYTV
jgi:hypothetical protein